MDFANHAANIRRSFADYWEAAHAPISSDMVDTSSTAMDAATASLLLCDELPELVQDSASPPLQVRELVRDVVLPLERDAFQQVVDAVRTLVESSKAVERSSCREALESLCPIRSVPSTRLLADKCSDSSPSFCRSDVLLI